MNAFNSRLFSLLHFLRVLCVLRGGRLNYLFSKTSLAQATPLRTAASRVAG